MGLFSCCCPGDEQVVESKPIPSVVLPRSPALVPEMDAPWEEEDEDEWSVRGWLKSVKSLSNPVEAALLKEESHEKLSNPKARAALKSVRAKDFVSGKGSFNNENILRSKSQVALDLLRDVVG